MNACCSRARPKFAPIACLAFVVAVACAGSFAFGQSNPGLANPGLPVDPPANAAVSSDDFLKIVLGNLQLQTARTLDPPEQNSRMSKHTSRFA